LPLEKVQRCLFETGFGFLFAPLFHPAMKYAIGPRREMGIRTIFNILGPLTNPAGAQRQILGVFADKLTETLALVLGNLGAVDAVVVHGEDGLDEVSISGRTKVSRFRDGGVHNFTIEPEDFGIWKNNIEQIRGGDKEENAAITVSVLKGEKGPRRDIVLMNSALALIAAGKTEDFKTAFQEASDTIDSERAFRKFEEIKKFSNSL
jgi:anthranilate phosphoribosyltransferase